MKAKSSVVSLLTITVCSAIKSMGASASAPMGGRPDKVEQVLKDASKRFRKLSPLLQAVIEDNNDNIAKILKKSRDVNKTDNKGYTSLHWACINGNLSVVKMLLDYKTDVDRQDNDGFTPLMVAVTQSNEDIVKVLITAKANVNIRDNNLSVLLQPSGQPSQRYLRKHKIAIDAKHSGYTPLMRALMAGNSVIVKLLLDADARIYLKAVTVGTDGKPDSSVLLPKIITAFDLAKDENKELLNGKDAFLQAVSDELLSLAHRIKGGQIKKLLKQGANINATDAYGRTALYHALSKGDKAIVKMIIDKGADINVVDHGGYTPLCWACECLNRYRGSDRNYDSSIIKMLIDASADADVNKAEYLGKTPLYYASLRGATDLAKILIDAGADINRPFEWRIFRPFEWRIFAYRGMLSTPLSETLSWDRCGNKEVARLLLAAGACVRPEDKEKVKKLMDESTCAVL